MRAETVHHGNGSHQKEDIHETSVILDHFFNHTFSNHMETSADTDW